MQTVLIHKKSNKTGKAWTAVDVYFTESFKKRFFLNSYEAKVALANPLHFDVVEVDE